MLLPDYSGQPRHVYSRISNPRAIPCDKSFFRYCKGAVANSYTGATIYAGAPIGTAPGLTVLLNGKAPPLNECGSE